MLRNLVPSFIKNKINPITEVHIENIEKTQNKLIRWAQKNKQAMLMFMPKNPNSVMTVLNAVPNPIGLHVHLSEVDGALPEYEVQLEKLAEGLKFMKELGVEVVDFASGHWNYDYYTFVVCKELGLKRVHIRCVHIPRI